MSSFLSGEYVSKKNQARQIAEPASEAEGKPAASVPQAKEAPGKDPHFVTALARGLEILRCFNAERQDLGATEIAQLTGLPQPTVWRLCKTLSLLGYLVPGRTPDRLQVGAGVLMLGHAAITHGGLPTAALVPMKEFAKQLGISVTLGERHNNDMVIIQRIAAPSILHLKMHIGSSLELGDSSMGWAWLAAQPEDIRQQAIKGLRKHYGARWPEISGKLDEAFEEYARYGYVHNFAKSHRDVNAIGVPVMAPYGNRTLALTCGGAKSSFPPSMLIKECAPAMIELARKIAPLLLLKPENG